MFTQCPQCDAIFQLSASQLKAANGEVRCGQCLSVFNALDHLSEEVPHAQETETADDLANDTDQYLDWSEESTAETPQDATPVDESPLQTHDATGNNDDVFSEVVAEISASNIPADEIDRFEEFLAQKEAPTDIAVTPAESTDEIQDASSSEESPLAAHPPLTEDATSLDDVIPVQNSFSTEDEHPADESSPDAEHPTTDDASLSPAIEEAISTENAFLAEGEETDISGMTGATDDIVANDIATSADEAPLGDIDGVTADLTTEISVDDDEFAELDAFLNEPGNRHTQADDPSANENTEKDDAIIINAADLEPVTSPDYADSLGTASAEDTSPATDKPAEQTDSADEPQTINIPTLILDDLHAAKAEQLRPSSTPWVVGSLVLMLTLVLQVVYHSRDELAKDSSLRPWLIQMCDVLGCTLSQPYDIKQIDIIGRDVRSHPSARKALVVSTTLINNAAFIQPFPLLTMTFSDINGRKIAQRRFTPREYLDSSIDLEAGMTPDLPVRIELELVDPGKAAVNYEFRPELDPRQTRPLS